MTTPWQDSLPHDPLVLRAAAKHNQAHVGVYAAAMQNRGDAVGTE